MGAAAPVIAVQAAAQHKRSLHVVKSLEILPLKRQTATMTGVHGAAKSSRECARRCHSRPPAPLQMNRHAGAALRPCPNPNVHRAGEGCKPQFHTVRSYLGLQLRAFLVNPQKHQVLDLGRHGRRVEFQDPLAVLIAAAPQATADLPL